MKIDGKHPIRQALRVQIRQAMAEGSITFTKDEFAQMIIKVEALVPKKRQPSVSWKGGRL